MTASVVEAPPEQPTPEFHLDLARAQLDRLLRTENNRARHIVLSAIRGELAIAAEMLTRLPNAGGTP